MTIAGYLTESASVLLETATLGEGIDLVASKIIAALMTGHKLVICGNGGSAADAQHFAAELTGKFERQRGPLAAISLTTDTSALTAIANDYSYDKVFARQTEALIKSGDVFIGITTSGNSRNVIEAAKMAKEKEAIVVALTGHSGDIHEIADYSIRVPSTRTCFIQQAHISVIHAICARIDEYI